MSEMVRLPPGVTVVRHPGVSIAYSGIEVGNTDGRFGEPEAVQSSRKKLLQALSPVRYIVQMPLGGSEFKDLSDIPESELADEHPVDGLIIDRPGIALGLNTADCIAMAIYGPENSALGVIHAGRKGVEGGIHTSAVEYMAARYDMAIGNIRIFFGPSIHQDSYFYPEISAEQLADPKWQSFIDHRDDSYHIDLTGRTVRDLTELGVNPNHIETTGIDVGAVNSGYFSHTRGKRDGEPPARNGFAAMLLDG